LVAEGVNAGFDFFLIGNDIRERSAIEMVEIRGP